MIAKYRSLTGVLAFLIVLFVMPLGHAVMILMEHLLGEHLLFHSAFVIGVIGVVITYLGLRVKSQVTATWLGFAGGVLVWTGWVEFGYIFFAQHLGVAPYMVDGEVVTKPEYLVMLSSVSILGLVFPYFLFSNRTRCNFFNWLQRNLRMKIKHVSGGEPQASLSTFMETVLILWTFYILLLVIYDDHFFGDHHPVTFAVLLGSLIWSIYLFTRLIRYRKMSMAIRYAIPTVIIFWNAVEILGRWGFYYEVWIDPISHWIEMVLLLAAFVIAVILARVYQNDGRKFTQAREG